MSFPLGLDETHESRGLAEDDVKCGELVGKEILSGEPWSNHTHLHKQGSVLTDMCFIISLYLNSDTSMRLTHPARQFLQYFGKLCRPVLLQIN